MLTKGSARRNGGRIIHRAVLAGSLLLLEIAAVQGDDKPEKEAAFTSLFNGKDFTGWRSAAARKMERSKRRTGRSRTA